MEVHGLGGDGWKKAGAYYFDTILNPSGYIGTTDVFHAWPYPYSLLVSKE